MTEKERIASDAFGVTAKRMLAMQDRSAGQRVALRKKARIRMGLPPLPDEYWSDIKTTHGTGWCSGYAAGLKRALKIGTEAVAAELELIG